MKEKTIPEFINDLASDAPAPGGGGAAALCGAVGTALGNMVASLTIGKKKYAESEELLKELKGKCNALQDEFLELIDKDAECFIPLSNAYRMPKGTPEEEEARAAEIERCSVLACSVPLEIMEKCGQAIDMIEVFAEKGSVLAVSDAGCAAIICKAALKAASLNVFINTKDMKDRGEAETLNAKVRELLYIYENKAESIYEMVESKLTGRKKKTYPFEDSLNEDNYLFSGINNPMDF